MILRHSPAPCELRSICAVSWRPILVALCLRNFQHVVDPSDPPPVERCYGVPYASLDGARGVKRDLSIPLKCFCRRNMVRAAFGPVDTRLIDDGWRTCQYRLTDSSFLWYTVLLLLKIKMYDCYMMYTNASEAFTASGELRSYLFSSVNRGIDESGLFYFCTVY